MPKITLRQLSGNTYDVDLDQLDAGTKCNVGNLIELICNNLGLEDFSIQLTGDRDTKPLHNHDEVEIQEGKVFNMIMRNPEQAEALRKIKNGKYFSLSTASEELRNNKDVVMAAVRQNGWDLQFASEELRGDKDVVLAVVKKDGRTLQFASEELRGDKDVVLAVVKKDGRSLQFANEELKKDKDVVLAAVMQDVWNIEHADRSFTNDKEVVLAAVRQYGGALMIASNALRGDKEVVLEAVKGRYGVDIALRFASEELKKDREIVLMAVRQNSEALEYAHKDLNLKEEYEEWKKNIFNLGRGPSKFATEKLEEMRKNRQVPSPDPNIDSDEAIRGRSAQERRCVIQ